MNASQVHLCTKWILLSIMWSLSRQLYFVAIQLAFNPNDKLLNNSVKRIDIYDSHAKKWHGNKCVICTFVPEFWAYKQAKTYLSVYVYNMDCFSIKFYWNNNLRIGLAIIIYILSSVTFQAILFVKYVSITYYLPLSEKHTIAYMSNRACDTRNIRRILFSDMCLWQLLFRWKQHNNTYVCDITYTVHS